MHYQTLFGIALLLAGLFFGLPRRDDTDLKRRKAAARKRADAVPLSHKADR